MEHIEIAVIGAGPAGSFCAYNLAKKGFSVNLFDYSHPREKPCGGGISPAAQQKYEFINAMPIKKMKFCQLRIISPSNKEILLEGEKGGCMVSRLQFDGYILEMALKEGAELTKEKVIDLRPDNRGWLIRTKKDVVHSKIIVGADGTNSIVRARTIGRFEKEDLGLTFGYFVKGIEDDIPTIKFLENKKGFIWAFTRPEVSSIGIGVSLSDRFTDPISNELHYFIKRTDRKMYFHQKWAALVPFITKNKTWRKPVSGDNWILIGDAAGHVDPIFAEGILYALWSAELAAKTISQNRPGYFDKIWRQAYGTILIEGSRIRPILYSKVLIELAFQLACGSQSLRRFLYDLIGGRSEPYHTIPNRLIKLLPTVAKENLVSKILLF